MVADVGFLRLVVLGVSFVTVQAPNVQFGSLDEYKQAEVAREFREVVSRMDRGAIRGRILRELKVGPDGASPEERYRQLATWIDETYLLAAYSKDSEAPFRAFYNFSLAPGRDRELIVSAIVLDRDDFTDLTLPLVPLLERARAELDVTLRASPPATITAALNRLRFSRFVPFTSGMMFGRLKAFETPYTVVLEQLGQGARAAERLARAAERASRQSSESLRLLAGMRSEVAGHCFSPFEWPSQKLGLAPTQVFEAIQKEWSAYLDTGSTATFGQARSAVEASVAAWEKEAARLQSVVRSQSAGARSFSPEQRQMLLQASCLSSSVLGPRAYFELASRVAPTVTNP